MRCAATRRSRWASTRTTATSPTARSPRRTAWGTSPWRTCWRNAVGVDSTASAGAALRRAVDTYLDHLTVERALAENTLASYRRDLNRYADWLASAGIKSFTDVGARDIAAHVAALRTGDDKHPALSASSVARAASAVRGLHRF